MYADYFLKFVNKEEADIILYTTHAATTNDDGVIIHEQYLTPNYQHIDVIGTIYDMIDDIQVPLEGYHVNVRVRYDIENTAQLLPYIVTPQHPRRIWAGGILNMNGATLTPPSTDSNDILYAE